MSSRGKRKAAKKGKQKLQKLFEPQSESDMEYEDAQSDTNEEPGYDSNSENRYDLDYEMNGSENVESNNESDYEMQSGDEDQYLQSQATAEAYNFDMNDDRDAEKLENLCIGLNEMHLDEQQQDTEATEQEKESESTDETSNKIFTDAMAKMTTAQLKKFERAYDKLKSQIPNEKDPQLSQFVYTLFWLPKKNFTFLDFIRAILYVGIGSWTRPYDHVILTHWYKELISLVEKFDCNDAKHDELLKMFDPKGHELFIARFKCKNRGESTCVEAGLIDGIGLEELIGNKIHGSYTSVPLKVSQQEVTDASFHVLHRMFLTLSHNYSAIRTCEGVLKHTNIFFERVIPSQLFSRYIFPKFSDAAWTRKLIEEAENSTRIMNRLGDYYSLLCASQIKHTKKAKSDDRGQFYCEFHHRNVENAYLDVYDSTPKSYSMLNSDELSVLRERVKTLAKMWTKRLAEENPERLNKIRRARRLAMKRWNQSAKGKACIKRYQKSEKGKSATKRYQKSEKGESAKKRYRGSDKAKATQKAYEQTDKAKTTRKRYRESAQRKASVKKYDQSEKGKASRKKYLQSEKGKASRAAIQKRYYEKKKAEKKAAAKKK